MSDYPQYPTNPPNQPPGWGQQPPQGPPPGPPPGPGNFEASAAIGYGWKAFTIFAGPLLGAALLVILAPGIVQGIGAVLGGGQAISFEASTDSGFNYEFSGVGLLFQLLASLVSLLVSAAMIRLALDIVDGNPVSFGAMFSRFSFVQVLIAAVLLSIATTIGLVLCILPGVVIAFLTWMTNYFIVGKGQDAITAIKSSVSLMTSHVGAFLVLAIFCIGCSILGLLACCVGLVVALPVVIVATAYSFRAVQSEPVRPL